MKISVVGLWHLGTVTAACMAEKGFEVIGYDKQKDVIDNLNKGTAPLFEPGLDILLSKNLQNGNLNFTDNSSEIRSSDLIWITYDTPVDEIDNADVKFVENEIVSLFPCFRENALILISSQLPVGSIAKLEKLFNEQYPGKQVSFSCSPENLRLGKAIEVFTNPDRIIVGTRKDNDRLRLSPILQKITSEIVWMSVESAEMTKHAVNAFLATSVVFINELAVLCEQVGADAAEVEKGLKSEFRIGPRAYLRPGSAFAGGTLARDVTYLVQKEEEYDLSSVFFSSIIESNEQHKNWVRLKLRQIFGNLENRTIGLLGLTYKPGTDTLRRSTAIELCYWLDQQKATIVGYDPALNSLPDELSAFISLQNSIENVLAKSDAIIVATECPEFKSITVENILNNSKNPFILDINGFLSKALYIPGINYILIGK